MTDYYAVTKFTSNQVLALFTADEFDAIDASENAEVKKTMRRLTSRSIMIDATDPNSHYKDMLDLLLAEALITSERHADLVKGVLTVDGVKGTYSNPNLITD
tara:strand:+ start:1686 stop:1991 length:306 start_codon:yes stop_codon:yes gene_type:complete